MRILITGGYGFIGSNLVRLLLGSSESSLGFEVDRIVNLNWENIHPVIATPTNTSMLPWQALNAVYCIA